MVKSTRIYLHVYGEMSRNPIWQRAPCVDILWSIYLEERVQAA